MATRKKVAADRSAPVKKGKGAGKSERNPSVEHSRRVKDARASAGKVKRSARGLGPPCEKCGQIHKRCSAHNRRGGPCGQQPLRFQQVCRSHGGSTKLSRKAAQERMMELVWPAIARLDHLVNDPDTDPAIVVKVVAQILDRAHGAGLSKHASVDVGFAAETEWERLGSSAFVILRGEENILDSPTNDEPEALPPGGVTDDELEAFLAERERRRAREASTKLDNSAHEVVRGSVQRSALDPFGQEARDRARSNRPSEFDPTPQGENEAMSGFRRYERGEE